MELSFALLFFQNNFVHERAYIFSTEAHPFDPMQLPRGSNSSFTAMTDGEFSVNLQQQEDDEDEEDMLLKQQFIVEDSGGEGAGKRSGVREVGIRTVSRRDTAIAVRRLQQLHAAGLAGASPTVKEEAQHLIEELQQRRSRGVGATFHDKARGDDHKGDAYVGPGYSRVDDEDDEDWIHVVDEGEGNDRDDENHPSLQDEEEEVDAEEQDADFDEDSDLSEDDNDAIQLEIAEVRVSACVMIFDVYYTDHSVACTPSLSWARSHYQFALPFSVDRIWGYASSSMRSARLVREMHRLIDLTFERSVVSQ